MSPRRRKDRHEASGFSRRPDPDSDEDEDYERERRKRSKGAVWLFMGKEEEEGGGTIHNPVPVSRILYFSVLS